MKIKRQIKPKVYKRFIKMYCTAIIIGAFQYFTDQSILGVINFTDNEIDHDQFSYLWVKGQGDDDANAEDEIKLESEEEEINPEEMTYMWLDVEFQNRIDRNNTNGYVIEYYNDGELCDR